MNLTELAIEQINNDKGFIKENNYKILKVEENYCELEGKVTETSLNPFGIAHGGYIFGLADTAAGIAAMTNGKKAVTINSTIDYFNMAKSNKIKAIAKCLKSGKNISNFEVFIYDDKETLIAKSNINYYYLDK